MKLALTDERDLDLVFTKHLSRSGYLSLWC